MKRSKHDNRSKFVKRFVVQSRSSEISDRRLEAKPYVTESKVFCFKLERFLRPHGLLCQDKGSRKN